MLVCTACPEWTDNIKKVEAPRTLMHARNPGTANYDGVPFRFCPWCGTALVEVP